MKIHVVEMRHRYSSGEWEPLDYSAFRLRTDAELDARNYERRNPRAETRIVLYARDGKKGK